MKEAKTVGQLLTEKRDDIIIKFMNDENKVTHQLEVYWSRKSGFPSLPKEVLDANIKFIVYDYGELILYC